jgi:hypothetical protein
MERYHALPALPPHISEKLFAVSIAAMTAPVYAGFKKTPNNM